jgi:hypothetical protein
LLFSAVLIPAALRFLGQQRAQQITPAGATQTPEPMQAAA